MPAELMLAAACCRWPHGPARVEAIRNAAAADLDWSRFRAVVVRNRIGMLAHCGLTQAGITPPHEVAHQLSERAALAARHGLATARESLRLQREFEAAGLPSLILKGAPLSILAYGDLGIKESLDIDLLISCDHALPAITLLRALGYEDRLLHLDRGQLDGYIRHAKEAPFIDRKSGLVVDLHWRLVDDRTLLPGLDVQGPSQEVVVPGGVLRTLAASELFAYLCVHGLLHNWARLKWIADLGAFLGKLSQEDVEHLYEAARRLEAARAASVALALCERLLGLELCESLRASWRRSRISRALQANALAGLSYREGVEEPERYSEGWLRTLAAQFLAGSRIAHPLSRARVLWNYPIDRTWLSLPRPLGFLYGVFRIPLWLARLTARAFRIRTV